MKNSDVGGSTLEDQLQHSSMSQGVEPPDQLHNDKETDFYAQPGQFVIVRVPIENRNKETVHKLFVAQVLEHSSDSSNMSYIVKFLKEPFSRGRLNYSWPVNDDIHSAPPTDCFLLKQTAEVTKSLRSETLKFRMTDLQKADMHFKTLVKD